MKANCYGVTDIGSVRKSNEDFYLIDDDLSLFIVCDGVGGSLCGEIASEVSARTIRENVAKNKAVIERYVQDESKLNRDAIAQMLQTAVQAANSKIWSVSESDERKRGMCTTTDVLLLAGDHAFLAHVGDSRTYLLREGKVHQLTSDHKVAEEMQKQGLWTAEDAQKSGYSNVLTRAVGVQKYVQCDTLLVELNQGDIFLLCSDGLHGYFSGNEFAEVATQVDLPRMPQALIQFAKDQGGGDNITAVVVRMDQPVENSPAFDALKKTETLGKVPLFRYLTYSELMQVLSLVRMQNFQAGHELMREGGKGDEMYIIVSGTVEVLKGGQVLAKRGKGEIFGDMGLFDNAPRSATVRTAEITVAMLITRKDLLTLLRRDSQIAVKFLWSLNQELSSRLRRTSQELAEAKAEKFASFIDEVPFAMPKD